MHSSWGPVPCEGDGLQAGIRGLVVKLHPPATLGDTSRLIQKKKKKFGSSHK